MNGGPFTGSLRVLAAATNQAGLWSQMLDMELVGARLRICFPSPPENGVMALEPLFSQGKCSRGMSFGDKWVMEEDKGPKWSPFSN